ncbi:MAG TPA: peptide chain release factor N(5)-glutamine methyltransferase [Campylobacterales bacterium]|nr:peptide chain release factor N(5)-glutamine methyltransferase [Campylobacterales bacterium]
MTIKEALKEASLILKNPKEASILLRHLLDYDQVQLLLNEQKPFEKYNPYQTLIKRRLSHEPIEYITEKVSFYSREFFIKQGALIPRPETEILVDYALEIKPQSVAEIGTGSGIISIMLALLIDNIKITATDISKEALEIAKINAEKFKVSDKITFVHTNYLDDIYDEFDMIISNPPYIAEGFELEENLSHEPQNALFGGKVGDEMLKEIVDIWIQRKCSYLLCEMGYDQKESMSRYLNKFNLKFYKDLAGFNRGFIAKRGF